jgi:hypothetical protein
MLILKVFTLHENCVHRAITEGPRDGICHPVRVGACAATEGAEGKGSGRPLHAARAAMEITGEEVPPTPPVFLSKSAQAIENKGPWLRAAAEKIERLRKHSGLRKKGRGKRGHVSKPDRRLAHPLLFVK